MRAAIRSSIPAASLRALSFLALFFLCLVPSLRGDYLLTITGTLDGTGRSRFDFCSTCAHGTPFTLTVHMPYMGFKDSSYSAVFHLDSNAKNNFNKNVISLQVGDVVWSSRWPRPLPDINTSPADYTRLSRVGEYSINYEPDRFRFSLHSGLYADADSPTQRLWLLHPIYYLSISFTLPTAIPENNGAPSLPHPSGWNISEAIFRANTRHRPPASGWRLNIASFEIRTNTTRPPLSDFNPLRPYSGPCKVWNMNRNGNPPDILTFSPSLLFLYGVVCAGGPLLTGNETSPVSASRPPPCGERFRAMLEEAKELERLADTLEKDDWAYEEVALGIFFQGYNSPFAQYSLTVSEEQIPELFRDEESLWANRQNIVNRIRTSANNRANVANAGLKKTGSPSYPRHIIEFFCQPDLPQLSKDTLDALWMTGYLDWDSYQKLENQQIWEKHAPFFADVVNLGLTVATAGDALKVAPAVSAGIRYIVSSAFKNLGFRAAQVATLRSLASGSLATIAAVVTKREAVWKLTPIARGIRIHEIRGGSNLRKGGLPPGFEVIDRWLNSVATSIKSVDLRARTYQNPAKLRNRLRGYVEDLAEFEGATRGGVDVSNDAIKKRVLEIVIPKGVKTPTQQAILEEVTREASMNNMNKIIIKVIELP